MIMQRFIFLCFCLFALAGPTAQAQGDREKALRFGVHLSPSFSRLISSDRLIESSGTNLGIKLGVVGEKFFTTNYAFSIGIGFAFNQGGTLQNGYSRGVFWNKSDLSSPTLDSLPKDAKLHYRIAYVEVPFGLKLVGGSGTDNPLRYYVEPGITLGFTTKALGDIKGTDSQNSDDENIRSDVKGLSLAWAFGGGVEYELAESLTIFGGLNYQRGISDVTSDNGTVQLASGAWRKESSKGVIGALTAKIGVFF
jgi:opacity protein-like surface antigen